jgi:hypothetical protein
VRHAFNELGNTRKLGPLSASGVRHFAQQTTADTARQTILVASAVPSNATPCGLRQ